MNGYAWRGKSSEFPRMSYTGSQVSGTRLLPQLSVLRLALLTDVIERNIAVTIAAVATTAERRTYIP
jgi:hypothetical protein